MVGIHGYLVDVGSVLMALTQGVLKQLERIISRKDNLIQHKCYKWKFEGKWLRAGDCHYMSDGKERVWEMTERTTKKGTIDGVDIIGMNSL